MACGGVLLCCAFGPREPSYYRYLQPLVCFNMLRQKRIRKYTFFLEIKCGKSDESTELNGVTDTEAANILPKRQRKPKKNKIHYCSSFIQTSRERVKWTAPFRWSRKKQEQLNSIMQGTLIKSSFAISVLLYPLFWLLPCKFILLFVFSSKWILCPPADRDRSTIGNFVNYYNSEQNNLQIPTT